MKDKEQILEETAQSYGYDNFEQVVDLIIESGSTDDLLNIIRESMAAYALRQTN